jgi:hypothetical protein
MDERQWPVGITATEYADDLRRAVRATSARLAMYERRGGHIVATLTPTVDVVPLEHQGQESLPYLLVVYSADRGIIISGHQVSGLAATGIPEEARWLG